MKKSKKVECHDTCPKCKRKMKETDKENKNALFYYCKNCKQKYRIYQAYKTQIIDCPHCKKGIRLTKNMISKLNMNTILNFKTKKVKV